MPSITTFDSEGAGTNATNLTHGIGTSVAVLKNHTGSAMDLSVASSNVQTVNVVRSGGNISDAVPNNGTFKINADESVILRVTSTQASQQWRISGAQTVHGLAPKPGTGHTGLSDEQTAGIYYGVI